MEPEPILVSACLLGVACTHTGDGRAHPAVAALPGHLVPVCPEVAGGLPTPRPRAERREDGTVWAETGEEVTSSYQRGAEHALAVARAAGARRAILKARSPSCGCHEMYRSGRLVPGEGVTAEVLRAAGMTVCSEEDI